MRRDVARRAIKRQEFRILLLVFAAAATETVAVFIVQSDSKVVQQVCNDIDPRAVLRCDGLRSRMYDNSRDVSDMIDTQIISRELYGVIKSCEQHARCDKRNCVSER